MVASRWLLVVGMGLLGSVTACVAPPPLPSGEAPVESRDDQVSEPDEGSGETPPPTTATRSAAVGDACPDACEVGQQRCSMDGKKSFETCVMGANACPSWTAAPCANDRACDLGAPGACVAAAPSTPPPSEVPICGTGLYCSAGPLVGASACRQSPTSTVSVNCCPSGQRFYDGRCAVPPPEEVPVCGTGLYCSGGPLVGASPCRQTPTSTATVYCCPLGQQFADGTCGAP